MSQYSKRHLRHLVVLCITLFVSLQASPALANCPYGSCSQLEQAQCLAICEPCTDYITGSCWDPYSHCWMVIVMKRRLDRGGTPEDPGPCYECAGVEASDPLWCDP
jgi:hypothetical protein